MALAIIAKTQHGRRVRAIDQTTLTTMLNAGRAKPVNNSKVLFEEVDAPAQDPTPFPQEYKTRQLKAEEPKKKPGPKPKAKAEAVSDEAKASTSDD